jgi:signal peptidase I
MMPERSRAQTILIAVTVTLGVLIVIFPFTGIVRSYRNTTGSMTPTLPIGSNMLVLRSERANRGDIVVFRYPLDDRLIHVKRVAGVAGDVIEIRKKNLFVNGKPVDEPYVMHTDTAVYPNLSSMPEPYRSRDNFGPYQVAAGQLFVLGDNRDQSSDSRYWGSLGRKQVIGHPILLYSGARGVWRP